ncbi:MAG TPA: hypothetical protein PKE06_07650, partial [Flavilitoribacter sp.]|nr:hypothetical protein [Flavilitoribacter sp.]HMQ89803.1 hypothetical protein [Flavilitoribacter sp.]
MSKPKNMSLFRKDLVQEAFKQSFVKLNPKIMFRNPVMFTVEIGTFILSSATRGEKLESTYLV